MRHVPFLLALPLSLAPLAADASGAQVPCTFEWSPVFDSHPGANDTVRVLTVLDDGSVPALFAAGDMTSFGADAGRGPRRYDDGEWELIAPMLSAEIHAAAVFADGRTTSLYFAGKLFAGISVANIVRWTGSGWVAVGGGIAGGVDDVVESLVVHDDGSGRKLVAGGTFAFAGGTAASNVARWDGDAWAPIGAGTNGPVHALATHGGALYAAGEFAVAGTVAASNIARWDGTAWAPLGAGVDGAVHALLSTPDGLVVAGEFASAGGAPANRIARWDGSAWAPLGNGVDGTAYALALHGGALHVGGAFDTAGGATARAIARWDGAAWSGLADPLATADGAGAVRALASHDGRLWAGGAFTIGAGAAAERIGWLDAQGWHALSDGANGALTSLKVHDDGGGPQLYTGGQFTTIGGIAAHRVARWDGATWESWAFEPVDSVPLVFEEHFDGTRVSLYAGGSFTSIGGVAANRVARWDGTSWSAVGTGIDDGGVLALAAFDDGTGDQLYASGYFTSVGGTPVANVARWDGQTWAAVGAGLGTPSGVFSGDRVWLRVLTASGTPRLYAYGRFPGNTARWDGAAWQSMPMTWPGAPPTGGVLALNVFHGQLYAGTELGLHVRAPIDGATWSLPIVASPKFASTLEVFDIEGAPRLYASGSFTSAGGAPASGIASWDGASWSALGAGLANGNQPGAARLAVFDAGDGPALYAGGGFQQAGNQPAWYFAKWRCAPPAIATVPGCHGSSEVLTTSESVFQLGRPATLHIASAFGAGWSFVFIGADGTDASGCGLFLPGLGELLLSPFVGPLPILDGPITAGAASFPFVNTSNPALVGVEFAFQAANVAFAPGAPLAMTNALKATLAP